MTANRRSARRIAVVGICLGLTLLTSECIAASPRTPFGVLSTTDYGGRQIRIEHVAVPFSDGQTTITLEGMLYRDISLGSWRGVVMTHGRNGPHPLRQDSEVFGYRDLNLALAAKGAAVLFLVRRGYGASEGEDSEFLDTAVECGIAASEDLAAGVAYLRGVTGVRDQGIVVMGHSQGGWAALAASTRTMPGVVACVNLCGGTNYRLMGSGAVTEKVKADWVKGSSELGSVSRIPVIWVYSENDQSNPAKSATDDYEAFREAGGKGKLHMLPPYGANGHLIIASPDLFLDQVLRDIAELEAGGA